MGSSEVASDRKTRDGGKFIELDVLVSANGTKGIISQRVSNGVITFSIVREFERDGMKEWTSFFAETQMGDFEDMVKLIRERIAQLRQDPKVQPCTAGMTGARR